MLSREYILNFVPTGMVPMRNDSPHVPLDVDSILCDVSAADALGITIVHVHVRMPDGTPTLERRLYSELVSGIRQINPELVVCVSCSGRLTSELTSRIEPLQITGNAKPDMASLTLGSLNFSRQASVNEPATIQGLAAEMLRKGIVPELEVFDSGMLNVLGYLRKRSLVRDPCYVNIILGNIATAQCDPTALGQLISLLPPDSQWAVGGIGATQLAANTLGLAAGGGVRIGLEDNLYLDSDCSKLATNLELLKRVHEIAGHLGRRVMSPAKFRELQDLLPGNGAYGRVPLEEPS